MADSYRCRTRVYGPLAVGFLHCLFVLSVATGCSSLSWKDKLPFQADAQESVDSIPEHNEVQIYYRTDADRLNIASGVSLPSQPNATQPGTQPLPAMTICTLQIWYPHPQVPPGHGLARVDMYPSNGDSAVTGSLGLGRLTSTVKDNIEEFQARNVPRVGSAAMPLPKWQIDSLMAKLEKDRFFRRTKELTPKVYLAVSRDGTVFGKNCKPRDELDALVLGISQRQRIQTPSLPYGPSQFSQPPGVPPYGSGYTAPHQQPMAQQHPAYQPYPYQSGPHHGDGGYGQSWQQTGPGYSAVSPTGSYPQAAYRNQPSQAGPPTNPRSANILRRDWSQPNLSRLPPRLPTL